VTSNTKEFFVIRHMFTSHSDFASIYWQTVISVKYNIKAKQAKHPPQSLKAKNNVFALPWSKFPHHLLLPPQPTTDEEG